MFDDIKAAIANQLKLHAEGAPGDFRVASLKRGYTFKCNHEVGFGMFVHRPDGTPCDCETGKARMIWYTKEGEMAVLGNGEVLMCPECFMDGT